MAMQWSNWLLKAALLSGMAQELIYVHSGSADFNADSNVVFSRLMFDDESCVELMKKHWIGV